MAAAKRKRRTKEEMAAARAEQLERERLREAQRQAVAAQCVATQLALQQATKRVPPEFQQWGSTRVRAWSAALAKARPLALRDSSPTPSRLERLQKALGLMRHACTAPLDKLHLNP